MELSKEIDFPAGIVLNVDKPIQWTSTDVVRKIKYSLERLGHRRIKVGHAGTLDPLATGVLVVCIGRATKRVDELQAERKEYIADIVLGATTASYDLEHPVEGDFPWQHISKQDVELTLKKLSGQRLQTPPVYSAKKFDGRRAYEMAREGEEPEMKQTLITIYDMELLECLLPDQPRIKIRVECSKGTYIRSLAHEIGTALASDGYLEALRRTRSGEFNINNSYSLEKIIKTLTPVKQN
jgi:tRNA pseudouridine55 synthase